MIDAILDFLYHFIGFRMCNCGPDCGPVLNSCNCHEGHGE